MVFSVGLFANAQTGNLFKPVKEVALRTPSVPIVVSDPHFSIWSPYDKLMEGSTEHWTCLLYTAIPTRQRMNIRIYDCTYSIIGGCI